MKIKPRISFLLFVLLFNGNKITAQPSGFSRVMYDSIENGIQAYSMVRCNGGGYLLAGNSGYSDAFLMKVDSVGIESWNKFYRIAPAFYSKFNSICHTADNNYFACGNASDSANGANKVLCIKLTPNGDTLWTKLLSYGTSHCDAFAVTETIDSGVVMTGLVQIPTPPYSKMFICKLNANGNVVWSKMSQGISSSETGYSIRQTSDSGYVVCGNSEIINPYQAGCFLLKLDKLGNVLWAKKYYTSGSFSSCSGYDVLALKSGYALYLSAAGYLEFLHTNLLGNVLSAKVIGNNSFINCYDCVTPKLHLLPDSGYYTCSGDQFEGKVTQTDAQGNIRWETGTDLIAQDLLLAPDSGYFVMGNGPLWGIRSSMTLCNQIGILKLDSAGNQAFCTNHNMPITNFDDLFMKDTIFNLPLVNAGGLYAVHPSLLSKAIISVDSSCVDRFSGIKNQNISDEFSLFPNPSNGICYLNCFQKKTEIQIQLFSLLGTKLMEQHFFNQDKVELNLQELAAGIYYLKISTGSSELTKKLCIQHK